jgi:hypothetical protein
MRHNNPAAAVWSCNTVRDILFLLPVTKNQQLRNVDDDSAIERRAAVNFDMFVTHLGGVN